MAVTIVRTASSSQIGSLLTQASASTTYATKASPTFTGTVNLASNSATGMNANNSVIYNVGALQFNDPGPDEGISWLGGSLWKIYESPDDLTNAAGNLQFVQGESSVRRMQLGVGGSLYIQSNIGIGDATTSTEARYIEIGSGRSASGYAYIDLIGDTTYTDYGLRIIRNNTGANTDSIISHRGTGILAISAQDAGSVRLSTNGSSRVEVKSTGDVGIGITSPLANLHIVDPNAATSDIRLGNNVNGTVMNLYTSTADLNLNNVTATGSLTLGTNNTTIMTINSAGNTTFTGTVSGSTAAVDTNTTQLATTAYVVGQAYAKLADTTFIGTTSIALNRASATQTLSGVNLSSGAAIGSLTITSGTISSTGSISLSPATGGTTDVNKIVRMSDVYNRTSTAAGNMLIATVPLAEVYRSTASSERWKNSINDLTGELEASKLLDIPVRQFKFNNDYLNEEDKRFDTLVPGFVAEEVAEHYPIAAEMGENGEVDDWNVRMIIPPMLKLIQNQDKKIKELEERLSLIENT
jgi:hypothetical protein